jgi:hypothetical protein
VSRGDIVKRRDTMRKLAITATFAFVVGYAGSAFAGTACEGVPDPETGSDGACAPCVTIAELVEGIAGGESDTQGCIAESGDPGSACVGGDAGTGNGCIALQDADGNGIFVHTGDDGLPTVGDESGCRAAAEAACGG